MSQVAINSVIVGIAITIGIVAWSYLLARLED